MSTAGILKTSTGAGFNLGKWLWKNKWIIILIFSIIPILLTSIQVSKETNNYSYIPISIGLSIINADSQLYENVQIIKTEPTKLIGMEKPTKNIFQKIKYGFKLFRVGWLFLGLVSLITLPFVFFRYLYLQGNNSTRIRATWKATITFFLFVLITNLIIMIVNMASGTITYTLDQNLDFFGKAKQVIVLILPFHGLVSLIKFLIGTAI